MKIELNELSSIKKNYDTFYYNEKETNNQQLNQIIYYLNEEEEIGYYVSEDCSGEYEIVTNMHGEYYYSEILIDGVNYKVEPIEVDENNDVEIGYIVKKQSGNNIQDFLDNREIEIPEELKNYIKKYSFHN